MSFLYLGALVVSLVGLGVLDRRFELALFVQTMRTVVTIAMAVAVFLVWDVLGVERGIFFIGDGPYQSGILLSPEIPIEEVFFLTLLTYQTLLLWRWFSRRQAEKA